MVILCVMLAAVLVLGQISEADAAVKRWRVGDARSYLIMVRRRMMAQPSSTKPR
jgi:uncharacterized membrane-anchored protein